MLFPVLSIAGSDSSGGAGIQADLKTFEALGAYGMTAITALTAQNTQGVSAISPVSPAFVCAQIEAIATDISIKAVKTGMLFSAEIISETARALQKFAIPNLVLDPVMVATSGHKLLQADAINEMQTSLFPLAILITPNLPEAELLTGIKIQTVDEMKQAAEKLAKKGVKNILLKGGHLSGEVLTDLLYFSETDSFFVFESPRIHTKNTHGTGCTLSAAIAALLAQGQNLHSAVVNARLYLQQAIKAGADISLGKGHGSVWHAKGKVDF